MVLLPLLFSLLFSVAGCFSGLGSYFRVSWKPLLDKASLYSLVQLSNRVLFDEFADSLLLIDAGICFIMFGGWFDFVWI